MVNFEKVLKEERKYLAKNEPTFYQADPDGRVFVGKVGRLATGEDIRIRIEIPEFYPIVKPTVTVMPEMVHPNVDGNGRLDLRLLNEWEPSYRVKDIIAAARRLFIHSRNLARKRVERHVAQTPRPVEPQPVLDMELEQLQNRVADLQKQLSKIERETREKREASFKRQGVQVVTNASPELELKAELQALGDLLELLDIKFEDAEIDQTDFFRLFKHYMAMKFKTEEKLAELSGGYNYVVSNKKKTEEPIRS